MRVTLAFLRFSPAFRPRIWSNLDASSLVPGGSLARRSLICLKRLVLAEVELEAVLVMEKEAMVSAKSSQFLL
jgi:hypothetical protein